MAGEDYKVEFNGEEMNISKAIRKRKAQLGMSKLNKMKDRFNFNIKSISNNIALIELNGVEYYFAMVKSKIRKKGSNTWTGRVVETLTNG